MPPLPEGLLTITDIQTVAKDTKLFRFEANESLSFIAGQFISLKFGDKSWRAYSIASSPNEKHIDLLIRIIPGGCASTILDIAKEGDAFVFRGPFGHFILSDKASDKLIFCATGTGIAPIRAMILTELEQKQPRPMQLWYGGRNPDDIAYVNELIDLPVDIKFAFSQLNPDQLPAYKQKNVQVFSGRITQFIEKGTAANPTQYYICGNGDMVKSVEADLKESGIEKSCITKERFN